MQSQAIQVGGRANAKDERRAALSLLAFVCIFAVAGMVSSLAGAPACAWPASAQVRFQGTSTLHDFEGQVAAQPFMLTLTSNTWSAKGEVLAAEMTTANTSRDRKMWNMLAASAHLRITGEIQPSLIPPPEGTNAMLTLRIRDQTHAIPVRITDWKATADEVRFHASWDVSLKQYGLKPPSVVGVIRVGDNVHLDAQVTARKPLAESPAAHVESSRSSDL